MRRVERRLLRLNDAIKRLQREEQLVAGELDMHRHLADDARRDAAVTDQPNDRADARDTTRDVARFEEALAAVKAKILRLEARRDRLLGRLRKLPD